MANAHELFIPKLSQCKNSLHDDVAKDPDKNIKYMVLGFGTVWKSMINEAEKEDKLS